MVSARVERQQRSERTATGTSAPEKLRWQDALLPALLFWGAGIALMFHPTLLSGFREIVGPPGDPRLLNYLLEHTYRWLLQQPLHENLWNPPFYYPAANTLALSDVLLGVAPLYWLWRALGFGPESAYQAFLVAAASVTFITTIVLLRLGFGRTAMAAAAGAFLFAFGAPRIAQLNHAQLIGHFYLPLGVLAAIRIITSERRATGWSVILAASVVLQLYSAFHLGWFMLLALALALGSGLTSTRGRNAIGRTLRLNAPALALAAAAAALILLPLAAHYLDAARLVGFRDWATEVEHRLPAPQSWLYVGPLNLAYGWSMDAPFFRAADIPDGLLGIGFITAAVAGFGLISGRNDRRIAITGLAAVLLILGTTAWLPGWSAWRAIHEVVPGAAALRAVPRVGLVVLLALAVGFAAGVERLRGRWRTAGMLVTAILIVEQIQLVPSVDKRRVVRDAAEIASRVGPQCASFYYAVHDPVTNPLPYRPWLYQLDGMRAQLLANVPTINGYSGWMPPDWQPLYDNSISQAADTVEVRARLRAWAGERAAPCIVTVPRHRDDDQTARATTSAAHDMRW